MCLVELFLFGEWCVSVLDLRVWQEFILQIWIVFSQVIGDGIVLEVFDILVYILGEGLFSWLYKVFVLEVEVVVGVGVYYQGGLLDNGCFGIYVLFVFGYILVDMEIFVCEQLNFLFKDGVMDEEV